MLGNEFWRQVEITPEIVVHESKHYLVVVTPTLWREQARSDTDRNLMEYSLVNKVFGCIEGSANSLPSVLISVRTLEDTLESLQKEERKSHANIVGLPSKDRTE